MLSRKQKNALIVLRNKLSEARVAFNEACEIRFQLINIEPNKDKDFAKWSKWHARFKLATEDFYKTLDRYNKAYNSYAMYRMLVWEEK